MKSLFSSVTMFVIVASVLAAGEKDKASQSSTPSEGEIKIYKRLIPADVLRGKIYMYPLRQLYSR